MTEAELQIQVAEYLAKQYPNILFHSDFGSGVKLTPGQAMKQKRQNGGRRAWPDLFIAEPMQWNPNPEARFDGLFIELKREGTRIKKKDGSWASPHVVEQAEILNKLTYKGYCAKFACGFDEAKKIIDDYLGGGK